MFIPLEQKIELQERESENKDFRIVIMPFEDIKILKFNQYKISDEEPFYIYSDLECIKENIDGCKNNLENLSTSKESKHIPSGFSMSSISCFRSIENKSDVYRGKGCMEKFCEVLRKHAIKIIYFSKNEFINKRAAGII